MDLHSRVTHCPLVNSSWRHRPSGWPVITKPVPGSVSSSWPRRRSAPRPSCPWPSGSSPSGPAGRSPPLRGTGRPAAGGSARSRKFEASGYAPRPPPWRPGSPSSSLLQASAPPGGSSSSQRLVMRSSSTDSVTTGRFSGVLREFSRRPPHPSSCRADPSVLVPHVLPRLPVLLGPLEHA